MSRGEPTHPLCLSRAACKLTFALTDSCAAVPFHSIHLGLSPWFLSRRSLLSAAHPSLSLSRVAAHSRLVCIFLTCSSSRSVSHAWVLLNLALSLS
ncbi:unnamed protein product [Sphenostylis stenocarpa]|uniref:Uncharacterized protein n=1 Tax=Sphenostylis stenocarpa TaxID=92480 RepID=A0AA86SRR9_9FABA|nr:unnamed protein product [Sphenostylis stenocarpa]